MHQIWGYFASEVSRSSPKQASFIVGYCTILTTFQLFCTNPAHFTFLTTSRVVVRHHASRNVFAWMSYWQKAAGPPKPAQSLQLTDFLLYEQTEKEKKGKKRWGGGVCVYMNDQGCWQATVHAVVCNPDIQLLCLLLRLFYLPREFGDIMLRMLLETSIIASWNWCYLALNSVLTVPQKTMKSGYATEMCTNSILLNLDACWLIQTMSLFTGFQPVRQS